MTGLQTYKEKQKEETIKYWIDLVAECRVSDKPIAQWCSEKGITKSVYEYWQRKVGATGGKIHFNEDQEKEYEEKLGYWRKQIEDREASKKSVKEWCREKNIDKGVYFRWLQKVRMYDLHRSGDKSIAGEKNKGAKDARVMTKRSCTMLPSVEYWEKIVTECEQSGKTVSSFCRENGIDYGQYVYRKRKVALLRDKRKRHEDLVAYWGKIVAECKASGKSAKNWCLERGINPQYYYNWVCRLNKEGLKEGNGGVTKQAVKASCNQRGDKAATCSEISHSTYQNRKLGEKRNMLHDWERTKKSEDLVTDISKVEFSEEEAERDQKIGKPIIDKSGEMQSLTTSTDSKEKSVGNTVPCVKKYHGTSNINNQADRTVKQTTQAIIRKNGFSVSVTETASVDFLEKLLRAMSKVE